MSHKTCRFYIQPGGPRPDFRLVKAFLWHDAQPVDSDGDSDNPASRSWTYLILRNRENEAEVVFVDKVLGDAAQEAPLVLEVESGREYLAARCAYFLAVSTNGGVSETVGENAHSPDDLVERMGAGFDVQAALRRVEQSPFSRSTLADPYPNLSQS